MKRTGQASYFTRERRQATVRTMERVMNITTTSPVSRERHILPIVSLDIVESEDCKKTVPLFTLGTGLDWVRVYVLSVLQIKFNVIFLV